MQPPEPAIYSLIKLVLNLQWHSTAPGWCPKMKKIQFSPLRISQAREDKQENNDSSTLS